MKPLNASSKRLLFTLLLFTTSSNILQAQDESSWFDFWVGQWEVSWDEQDGKTGRGKNRIVKILDNTVIQENFRIEEGTSKGYLGTSISVYNAKTRTWHQGYADNQGAYFNLTGERTGDKRIFKTEPVTRNGKQFIQRMVFYDITHRSFIWDWESSDDGGTTWKLNWRIRYTRL